MAYGHDGGLPSKMGAKPTQGETPTAYMLGAAAAVFLILVSTVPVGLVVPAFALVAMAAGLGLALYAWARGLRQERGRITCWDLASTSMFVGFAAGVMGEPQHVMDLTAHLSAPGR